MHLCSGGRVLEAANGTPPTRPDIAVDGLFIALHGPATDHGADSADHTSPLAKKGACTEVSGFAAPERRLTPLPPLPYAPVRLARRDEGEYGNGDSPRHSGPSSRVASSGVVCANRSRVAAPCGGALVLRIGPAKKVSGASRPNHSDGSGCAPSRTR